MNDRFTIRPKKLSVTCIALFNHLGHFHDHGIYQLFFVDSSNKVGLLKKKPINSSWIWELGGVTLSILCVRIIVHHMNIITNIVHLNCISWSYYKYQQYNWNFWHDSQYSYYSDQDYSSFGDRSSSSSMIGCWTCPETTSVYTQENVRVTMEFEVPKIHILRPTISTDMVQRVLQWERQKRRSSRTR